MKRANRSLPWLKMPCDRFCHVRTVKQPRKPVKLTTVSGQGVRPGIDLDDSASLFASMETPHGSS